MKKYSILLTLILLNGCSSMFSSKDQEVFFDSNLTDVEIYIDNVYTCTTPCIAQVERMRKEMMVTAKKQGYDEINIRTNSNITTATLFNISMTGLSSIGTSIDMTSGHAFEYQPNSYYITFNRMPVTPEEMAEREKEDAIRIFALKNYTDISKEVHSAEENRQEYLTALSGMSHLSVYHIKKIHSDSESESDFADNILKAYQEKMNYN